jgi:hemerythrin-like domain-containing protein
MNQLISRLSPSITSMIRMDHTHVLATFHEYDVNASPRVKKALADSICLWLEIHAQLEEEIFYPAMQAIADNEFMKKSVPEHDDMRRLITQLRGMQSGDPSYDQLFYELMNVVIHHVADEETLLLPTAERVLSDQLGELGAQMTKRRLQLAAPHGGQIAGNVVRSMGAGSLIVGATALLAGSYLLTRPRGRRNRTTQRSAGSVPR